jgi:NAD(P)H dehydrogenase (quinone)
VDFTAVTGANGKLGSRVARALATAGVEQLLLARDPAKLPSIPGALPRGPAPYDDAEAMRTALHGAATMVLISGHLSGRRLAEHTTAVDAAVAAGVRRVVYVSLMGAAPAATYLNARDHWQTEQVLSGRGVRYTVVRPCFYASMVPGLAVDGVIRGSRRRRAGGVRRPRRHRGGDRRGRGRR